MAKGMECEMRTSAVACAACAASTTTTSLYSRSKRMYLQRGREVRGEVVGVEG